MAKDIEVKKDNASPRTPSVTDPFNEMNQMMDSFFRNPFSSWMPEVSNFSRRAVSDIKETDKCYLLTAELPGIPKEDIEIDVNGNMLTIRAEHKQEENKEQSYRREYRSFNQSFVLPSTVDASQIEAHCDNGLLEVMLPKTQQAQAKRVEIQSGKGSLSKRLMGNQDINANTQNEKSKH